MENSSAESTQASSGGIPARWCYQCNAAIVAGNGASDEDLICPYCGGFIESLDSVRTLPNVLRAARRQRRQRRREMRRRAVDDGPTDEDMEDATPQQVLRFLRILAGTYRNRPPARTMLDIHDSGDVSPNDANGHYIVNPPSSSLSNQTDLEDEEIDVNAAELPNQGDGEENADDVEEEGGTEGEGSLVGSSDGDSFDDGNEDEWEEVELDDAGLVRFLEDVNDGAEGERDVERGHESGDGWEVREGEHSEASDPTNELSSTQNRLSRHLRRRYLAIRRSLDNYIVEIQVGGHEGDNYIGNPGDYVDARGFEEILQHFIDTDNTHKGAPPAAKAAIESLSLLKIRQENLENGSALCAICKELVELDEPARQLPCLHLYHSECIVAWLGARNSCPVCRYELPTDDPDYEEQKKRSSAITTQTSDNAATSSTLCEVSAEVLASEGNRDGDIEQTER